MARGKHELGVAHACTQVGASCNRLASDLVLFTTAEFDFVDLPPEHCTGSSIMPQKQNPDVLELARAYHHRLTTEMQHLATGPSNLPSGYHRDLQLTKAAVMRSIQMTTDVLAALTEVVRGTSFNPEQTRGACTPDLLATQRALERVAEGVPFRTAYHQVAAEETEPGPIDSATVLDAYETDGSPGRERPDLVRDQLETHRGWIAEV
jgi:argininosuccinate lyase